MEPRQVCAPRRRQSPVSLSFAAAPKPWDPSAWPAGRCHRPPLPRPRAWVPGFGRGGEAQGNWRLSPARRTHLSRSSDPPVEPALQVCLWASCYELQVKSDCQFCSQRRAIRNNLPFLRPKSVINCAYAAGRDRSQNTKDIAGRCARQQSGAGRAGGHLRFSLSAAGTETRAGWGDRALRDAGQSQGRRARQQAFVEVRLEHQNRALTERFEAEVQKFPEVLECYLVVVPRSKS